ncbi:MAG TPA: hypothetical protein ENG42_00145 [Candidatus Aenigmarchaeota archaeon]|nr:hypothetical protein [Candidatus Aenigmarchaeota archaeon]
MILVILGLIDLISAILIFLPAIGAIGPAKLIVIMGLLLIIKGFYSLFVKSLVPGTLDIMAGFILLFLLISFMLPPVIYILFGLYLLIKGLQSIVATIL